MAPSPRRRSSTTSIYNVPTHPSLASVAATMSLSVGGILQRHVLIAVSPTVTVEFAALLLVPSLRSWNRRMNGSQHSRVVRKTLLRRSSPAPGFSSVSLPGGSELHPLLMAPCSPEMFSSGTFFSLSCSFLLL